MQLKDERGMMAIGVALMLIVVLALFGGALWQYSMFELKRVERTEEDLQALFLARAGAEAVMGAWKKRLVRGAGGQQYAAPFGRMETLYYDLDRETLTWQKPGNYLGQVDVVVKEEQATAERQAFVTVIEATAKVGSTSRTVRLVTYPHRYGHHQSLKWYVEDSGELQATSYDKQLEPVIMRTRNETTPIYFGSSALRDISDRDRPLTLTASAIVFESPLQLVRSAGEVYNSPAGSFDLVLEAEKIFFNGLEVAYLPSADLVALGWQSAKDFGIRLAVPNEWGFSGSEVVGKVEDGHEGKVDLNGRYGEVYFYGNSSSWQHYEWYRRWLIIIPDPIPIAIPIADVRATNRETLTDLHGKGFFFKDGWRLIPRDKNELYNASGSLDISGYLKKALEDGWLIPIKEDEQTSLEALKDLRPFFWEK